jgi:hypothetical protein
MEPRGCDRWQPVANPTASGTAETRENRCHALRPAPLGAHGKGLFLGFGVPSGRLPECSGMSLDERRYASYECGSTSLVTTQRCLPILRSRTNPSLSYVDRAPWKRKPAGTEPASSG